MLLVLPHFANTCCDGAGSSSTGEAFDLFRGRHWAGSLGRLCSDAVTKMRPRKHLQGGAPVHELIWFMTGGHDLVG